MPFPVQFFLGFIAVAVALILIVWAGQRLLVRFFPPAKPQRGRVRAHYVGLRLISGVLRLVGWLSIFLSIVVFAVAIDGAGQLGLHFRNLNDQIRPMFASIGLLISFSFFTWGLFTLAFGELLKVLVDIALSTAILPNIAEDTNYFYERLNPQQ